MPFDHPRMDREARTIQAMIRLYCRQQHGQPALCPHCARLEEYALARLERCPFQEDKTTCVNCPVHCYKPEMRAEIRQVMRYAGPRMLIYHPILTIHHLLDGRRKQPLRPLKRSKSDSTGD